MNPLSRLPILVLLTWLALVLATASRAAPPAAELFFQTALLSATELSPDGRAVAMRVLAKGGRARLVALDLQTLKPTVVGSFDGADVGQFRWVNERRLVFDLSQDLTGPGRAEFGPGLYAVNADGSKFRQLVEASPRWLKLPESGVPMLPSMTRLWLDRGRQMDDQVWVVSPGEVSREKVDYLELQRLNTATGRTEPVDAPLHTVDWTFDANDQLRLATTRQGSLMAVHWRDAAGAWNKLAEFDWLEVPWTPRFIDADGKLYVDAPKGDKTALFTLDPATGKLSPAPLAASKDFDIHARFLTRGHKLLGLRYTIDAEVTQWFDADAKALQATIDKLLPDTVNRLGLPSRGDSPQVLVEAFADVQPTLTYAYNQATRKLTLLGASHPGISPKQMGLTDFVRYKARDGLEIPAYLTLPPGVTLANAAGTARYKLPLVVLVHGGPWTRGASWEWQSEVQFLASRGYAVLQPEFRGSTGFGRKHFEAGWKQWGQAMQTDLADGARWAIAQGIADPQRIAIAGASYGGYAVLMGLAQEPELLRAGIDWVGVTDPQLLFTVSWSDATEESKKHGMARMMGDPVADAAMLKVASPLENAARIKQPLLMAYGAWDVRVPIVHGEKFRDAAKPHNPQLEWLVYPEEGHGWSKPETRIDFWGRVEAFLARHLAAR